MLNKQGTLSGALFLFSDLYVTLLHYLQGINQMAQTFLSHVANVPFLSSKHFSNKVCLCF